MALPLPAGFAAPPKPPPPREAVVDPDTGLMTNNWYQYHAALQRWHLALVAALNA